MAGGPTSIPFESRYVVRPNGCWEWTGAVTSAGYGSVSFEGEIQSAHRVAYELWVGPIPEDGWVLHSCDNRQCICPEHLLAGTPAQNTKEAIERKRMKPLTGHRGETAPYAKLTDVQVLEIRDLFDQGWGCKDIGEAYGVNEQTIRLIGKRVNWKSLKEKVAA